MPNFHTSSGAPMTESLHLRLTRDILVESGVPPVCPHRQCRRRRACCGPALPVSRPITPDEHMPPCMRHADVAMRHITLELAVELATRILPGMEPHQWPDDQGEVAQLRLLLAMLRRIHSRPGRHPASEIESLAAWAASDPDPAKSAAWTIAHRHGSFAEHRRDQAAA
jgi:hypothetical protein